MRVFRLARFLYSSVASRAMHEPWVGWAFVIVTAVVSGVWNATLIGELRLARIAAVDATKRALTADAVGLDFARKAVDLQRRATRYLALSVELRRCVVDVLDGDPRDAEHTLARVELRRALAAFDAELYAACLDDAPDEPAPKGPTTQ